MDYLFYRSYVDLLDQDYTYRKELSLTEFEKALRFTKFRNFFLQQTGHTFSSILRMENIMRSGMLRPQRLLVDNNNFYVGCDMLTNTYYICYRSLMMIDIDFYKDIDGKTLNTEGPKNTEGSEDITEGTKNTKGTEEQIIELFKQDTETNPSRGWRLYRSRGGIHAFLTTSSIVYHSQEACEIMLKLKCDFNYVIYSYLRGWCVRLNKKKLEDEVNYTYICDSIGSTGKPLSENIKLIDLHLNLVKVFKDEDPSTMFGV